MTLLVNTSKHTRKALRIQKLWNAQIQRFQSFYLILSGFGNQFGSSRHLLRWATKKRAFCCNQKCSKSLASPNISRGNGLITSDLVPSHFIPVMTKYVTCFRMVEKTSAGSRSMQATPYYVF